MTKNLTKEQFKDAATAFLSIGDGEAKTHNLDPMDATYSAALLVAKGHANVAYEDDGKHVVMTVTDEGTEWYKRNGGDSIDDLVNIMEALGCKVQVL